jgi:four helix bundle protein
MRRAALSIMSNIAEGFSRYSMKDSKQFFVVARGSLAELRSQVYVALDQQYLIGQDAQNIQEQIETTGKLLSGLIRSTRRRLHDGISDEVSGIREPFNY